MYDMYPWDTASQGDYPPAPLRSRRNQLAKSPQAPKGPEAPKHPRTPGEPSPTRAVQIALDRRDNGGSASR